MKKVSVVGLGYIGLPLALIAAKSNLSVVGIDNDPEKIESIKNLEAIIQEPEIATYLQEAYQTGNFSVSMDYQEADYFLICVSTPLMQGNVPDLSALSSVAIAISDVIKKGDTVIIESTVPVGTTQIVADIISENSALIAGVDFFIAHCPERVLPGNIFQEMRVNDRIIGGINQASVQQAATFYSYFVSGDLYLTTAETSELVKLIENSHRDMNKAFANEVAAIAYKEGLDPFEVIELANKHPRVALLKPSAGTSGYCLKVDPWSLITAYQEETLLLKAARSINTNYINSILSIIERAIQEFLTTSQKCTVGILGLTYDEPDTNDISGAPAYQIASLLLKNKNISVVASDPTVYEYQLSEELKKITISSEQLCEKADIIIGLVAHPLFKELPASFLVTKKIIDIAGVFYSPYKESADQEQFVWPKNRKTTDYDFSFKSSIYQKQISE